MEKKIAILDLGTNTFHLLIARVDTAGYHVVYREKIPVKIGQGGINKGLITEAAIARALEAIHSFVAVIKREKIELVRACATSAFRNAKNGSDIMERIKNETGLEVEIISGNDEAAYIYYGVKEAMNIGEESTLIMDIGGGSVEFIIGNNERYFWKRSFEIGAQRLFDLFHRHDPMLTSDIDELNDYFYQELSPLQEAVKIFKPTSLIGASGTFDTLSEIDHKRRNIAKELDSSYFELSIAAYHEIHRELLSKNKSQRLLIPGMMAMRADMIVVASALLSYILGLVPFNLIRISRFSLKEGVLSHFVKSEHIQLTR